MEERRQDRTDRRFPIPFYATGYPLTEACWTEARVGGVAKQVLVPVFERRVLSSTGANPVGCRWRRATSACTTPSGATALKAVTPAPAVEDIDDACGDFWSHDVPQCSFASQGGSPTNAVDGLDSNSNGSACESLP